MRVHRAAAVAVVLVLVAATSDLATRTDRAGGFAFAGLPVGGLRVFLVSTMYQGATYGAGRVTLTDEAPVRNVPLAVYEAGIDRRALRGTLFFSIVDVAPGRCASRCSRSCATPRTAR